LTFRWHSIAALLLTASTALAGWDGFPCPSNVSWYAVETNHYWAQLMTGLVERCKAAGVAAPAIVDTYTNLFAGYTNTYTATNGCIVTNNWICYTNRTVTNQFLPFEYSWSQTNGTSGTATCYPAIKQSWVAAWDSKFASIIGGPWVRVEDCGLLSNETADAYFATFGTNAGADFPIWTRTNLFLRQGIGSGTNGGGLFSHTPELLTNEWALGVIRKTTNSSTSWSYQEMTPITTTIYDTSIRPVFEYWPSWPTNELSAPFNSNSLTFTITGTILTFPSQTATSGTEVITITASGDAATVQPWYRITGIACTNTPPNKHDAWRVVYKDAFPIYGGNPYRLYAVDINERQAALDPLVCTRYAMTIGESDRRVAKKYGYAQAQPWATVVAAAQADYDDTYPAGNSNTFNYVCGSWAVKNPNVYPVYGDFYLLIWGNSTTNFSFTSYPSTMASQAVVRAGYMTLFPYYVPAGYNQAYPHEAISNIIFDTFGLYTNFVPYTLASIGTALSPGSTYDGWTIGQTNIPSNICDEPTVETGGDRLNDKYRGYTYVSSYAASLGYTFWGSAMHTNWMTKY
jgi:hypothetical protein